MLLPSIRLDGVDSGKPFLQIADHLRPRFPFILFSQTNLCVVKDLINKEKWDERDREERELPIDDEDNADTDKEAHEASDNIDEAGPQDRHAVFRVLKESCREIPHLRLGEIGKGKVENVVDDSAPHLLTDRQLELHGAQPLNICDTDA